MVQYAEIKEVSDILNKLETKVEFTTDEHNQIIDIVKKYHTILEGWYGDEQYHNKVEEGLEL